MLLFWVYGNSNKVYRPGILLFLGFTGFLQKKKRQEGGWAVFWSFWGRWSRIYDTNSINFEPLIRTINIDCCWRVLAIWMLHHRPNHPQKILTTRSPFFKLAFFCNSRSLTSASESTKITNPPLFCLFCRTKIDDYQFLTFTGEWVAFRLAKSGPSPISFPGGMTMYSRSELPPADIY